MKVFGAAGFGASGRFPSGRRCSVRTGGRGACGGRATTFGAASNEIIGRNESVFFGVSGTGAGTEAAGAGVSGRDASGASTGSLGFFALILSLRPDFFSPSHSEEAFGTLE